MSCPTDHCVKGASKNLIFTTNQCHIAYRDICTRGSGISTRDDITFILSTGKEIRFSSYFMCMISTPAKAQN